MDVYIDLLQEEDLDEILAIEQASFPEPWTRAMFNREMRLPFSNFFVLKKKQTKKILGYGGYWVIDNEAHLTNIAVAPEFRRRGWGKFLLTAILEYAKKNKIVRVLLEVRKSNLVAQQLYRQLNFRLISVRKGYYTAPELEDALILAKDL